VSDQPSWFADQRARWKPAIVPFDIEEDESGNEAAEQAGLGVEEADQS
jgi:hypothetical protein